MPNPNLHPWREPRESIDFGQNTAPKTDRPGEADIAELSTPENEEIKGRLIEGIFEARHLVRQIIHPRMQPETRKLTEEGVEQVRQHIDLINMEREIINEDQRAYLLAYSADVIAERNVRGDEAESKEVREAADIMKELYHYAPHPLLCIDGRINPTVMFGITAQMKGSPTQVPAGDSHDFKPDRDGNLFLERGSNMAKQLEKALEGFDKVSYVLDSHLACAAREEHEKGVGNPIVDHGLREDVIRKRKIAAALKKYAKAKLEKMENGSEKEMVPIQLSFDPHNGFLYMGLEKDGLLAESKDSGYTDAKIEELVGRGEVISTKKIAEEPFIREKFEAAFGTFRPKPDWKANYKETAIQFWTAIRAMAGDVIPQIIERLEGLYPEWKGSKALEDRAMLLLCSAFVGYCNNADGTYRYKNHMEDGISTTVRAYPPAFHMLFQVNGELEGPLKRNTIKACELVRAVRGKEETPNSHFRSREEYKKAPIMNFLKEVIRTDNGPIQWDELKKINWGFLERVRWDEMSDSEFENEIAINNPKITIDYRVVNAINNLRRRMAILYSRNSDTSEWMMEGKLVTIPWMADKSGRFQVRIPFVKRGFEPR